MQVTLGFVKPSVSDISKNAEESPDYSSYFHESFNFSFGMD